MSLGSGIREVSSAFGAVEQAKKHQEYVDRQNAKIEIQQQKLEIARQREERLRNAQQNRSSVSDKDLINDIIELRDDVSFLLGELSNLRIEMNEVKSRLDLNNLNPTNVLSSNSTGILRYQPGETDNGYTGQMPSAPSVNLNGTFHGKSLHINSGDPAFAGNMEIHNLREYDEAFF